MMLLKEVIVVVIEDISDIKKFLNMLLLTNLSEKAFSNDTELMVKIFFLFW